ncbi:MAG: DUF1818 family protein [Cyanobacteria bacterium P01_G01_bin.19]
MERFIKSGDGWRIGWHPHGTKYQGLVGAEDWAIELSRDELRDFCRLLARLVDTMTEMSGELMDEEKISCEAETDLIWMEVEGYADSYSLRLILNCDRRCEVSWQEKTAPQIVAGFKAIGFSYENNCE